MAKNSLFTFAGTLGYSKISMKVPDDFIEKKLKQLSEYGKLEEEEENSLARLKEYTAGMKLFAELLEECEKNQAVLQAWHLAARNLVNRARTAVIILQLKQGKNVAEKDADRVLRELRGLRCEMNKVYHEIMSPLRGREIVAVIFDAIENALETLI